MVTMHHFSTILVFVFFSFTKVFLYDEILIETLKREHQAFQKMMFLLFLFLWVIFALLNPEECGSGSSNST
jgi:hypothetical protein